MEARLSQFGLARGVGRPRSTDERGEEVDDVKSSALLVAPVSCCPVGRRFARIDARRGEMLSEASLKHASAEGLAGYYSAGGTSTHDRSMTDSSSAPEFRVSRVSSEGMDDEAAVTRVGGGSSAIDFRLPEDVVPDADTGLVQTVGGAVNGVDGLDVGLGE